MIKKLRIFLWMFLPLAALAQIGSEKAKGPRPNILFILADDLGYGDLGCYGQQKIATPNIDRLASQGMRFTQFYAGASVCAPSRSVLMTGIHNGHGRVRDNLPHGVHLKPWDVTVAEVLQRAGYRTGGFGKWGLGDHGNSGTPWLKGFEEFYGYLNQDHAHIYYTDFLWDTDRIVLLRGNRGERRQEYVPDLLTERALAFIDRTRDDSRPFFLYYPTILPHFSDYSGKTSDSLIVPSDAPYSSRDWPQVEKNYAAMITRLDHDVGRLLDRLEKLGIADKTLVIFSSDNGPSAESLHRPDFFKSAGKLRGVKRELYEGSIRVPAIMRWPGTIMAGAVNETIAGFVDIMPTFAELAEAAAPAGIDGLSFAPILRGSQPARTHEYLYWDYGHVRPRFLQAARAGKWKVVRNGLDQPVELYDLEQDPAENRNVAGQHPEVSARMKAILAEAFVPSPDFPLKSVDSKSRESVR